MRNVKRIKQPGIVMFISLLALLLPACSSYSLKHGTYDALYRKQCIDHTGTPDCEPDHKRYDDYRRERDDVLKQER